MMEEPIEEIHSEIYKQIRDWYVLRQKVAGIHKMKTRYEVELDERLHKIMEAIKELEE